MPEIVWGLHKDGTTQAHPADTTWDEAFPSDMGGLGLTGPTMMGTGGGANIRETTPVPQQDPSLALGNSSPQDDQGSPWAKALMAVSGGLEGFSAGMHGRTPAAVGMAHNLQQQKLAQQRAALMKVQADRQARLEQLDTLKVGLQILENTDLPQDVRDKLNLHLTTQIMQHMGLPAESVNHVSDAMTTTDGRGTLRDLVNEHPFLTQYNQDTESFIKQNRVPYLKAQKYRMERAEKVNTPEFRKEMRGYEARAADHILGQLTPDDHTAIQGKTVQELRPLAEQMPVQQGQPSLGWLLDRLDSTDPEMNTVLEGHGIKSPRVVAEEAKSVTAEKAKDTADPYRHIKEGPIADYLRTNKLEPTAENYAKAEKHVQAQKVEVAKAGEQGKLEAAQAPLTPMEEKQAQAIAAYHQAPIGQYALTRPGSRGLAIMARVEEIHQQQGTEYDAKEWSKRQQTMTAFAKGPQGDTVRSLNVAIDHMETLRELGMALKNHDVRALNALDQWFQTQIGRPAPRNFDEARRIVGQEVTKAIVRAGGGEQERQEAKDAVSKADSPAALVGVIETRQKLLAGQLSGLRRQYKEGSGRDDFETMISPTALRILKPLEQGETAQSESKVWNGYEWHLKPGTDRASRKNWTKGRKVE